MSSHSHDITLHFRNRRSDFSDIFPVNFCTNSLRFKSSTVVGWMENVHEPSVTIVLFFFPYSKNWLSSWFFPLQHRINKTFLRCQLVLLSFELSLEIKLNSTIWTQKWLTSRMFCPWLLRPATMSHPFYQTRLSRNF